MKVTYVLSALLAAETAVASSWFTKAAYNKWHETELERWLSDHDVPYPTPADRKDLENLVKSNWQTAVESPYVNWDANRLQKQIQAQGQDVKKSAAQNKDELVKQVKSTWVDTESSANSAYASVKDWIFDSWSDSQLKAFCDKHSIPVPQPTTRDVLVKQARENYQSVANKISETSAYPGNWLWQNWSDSDLKAWLDERGIPAPQGGKRDKLVAEVRRNSRVASLNSKKSLENLSSSASAATSSLSSEVFDSWSDSELKDWFDKNDIKVPQGSKRNELLAVARKNSKKLTDSASDAAASASSSASSASSKAGDHVGAATSSAGNQYAKATEDASLKGQNFADGVYSQVLHYVDEAQIALGLKDSYASSVSKSAASVSKSAASAYSEASKAAKSEL